MEVILLYIVNLKKLTLDSGVVGLAVEVVGCWSQWKMIQLVIFSKILHAKIASTSSLSGFSGLKFNHVKRKTATTNTSLCLQQRTVKKKL